MCLQLGHCTPSHVFETTASISCGIEFGLRQEIPSDLIGGNLDAGQPECVKGQRPCFR